MEYKASIVQKDMNKCFFCGTSPTAVHHVFNGPNRKASTKYGCVVGLCPTCHQYGTHAVHVDKQMDLVLKRVFQKKFEEIYDHELFMQTFHKSYVD